MLETIKRNFIFVQFILHCIHILIIYKLYAKKINDLTALDVILIFFKRLLVYIQVFKNNICESYALVEV